MAAAWRAAFLVALCLGAGAASAAFTLRPLASTLTTSAASPPFTFAAGAQGSSGVYVTAFSLSGDRASFDAKLRGVPHATIVLPQLCTLTNERSTSQTLTIAAPTVGNASIPAFELSFHTMSGRVLGTLDLRAASPSTSFTLAGRETVDVRATLGLAEGAGAHNVNAKATLRFAAPG